MVKFAYYVWQGKIFCQKYDSDIPQKYEFIANYDLPSIHTELTLDELKLLYPCPRELIDVAALQTEKS